MRPRHEAIVRQSATIYGPVEFRDNSAPAIAHGFFDAANRDPAEHPHAPEGVQMAIVFSPGLGTIDKLGVCGVVQLCQFGLPKSIAAQTLEFAEAAVTVTVVPETVQPPAITTAD